MRARRLLALALVVSTVGGPAALGQTQPVTSAEDARCRGEARDHVFTASNPGRLSLYDLGANLYHACMRRLGAERRPPTRR